MEKFSKLSFMIIKKVNFKTIKVLIQLFNNKRISLLMLNLQCIIEWERETINNKHCNYEFIKRSFECAQSKRK